MFFRATGVVYHAPSVVNLTAAHMSQLCALADAGVDRLGVAEGSTADGKVVISAATLQGVVGVDGWNRLCAALGGVADEIFLRRVQVSRRQVKGMYVL